MAQHIRCPSCGNEGEATIDESGAFEVRGQFEGRPIRKCRKCGVGLVFGIFGSPKLIPVKVWNKLEKMWEEEFGAS